MKLISIILLSLFSLNANSQAKRSTPKGLEKFQHYWNKGIIISGPTKGKPKIYHLKRGKYSNWVISGRNTNGQNLSELKNVIITYH